MPPLEVLLKKGVLSNFAKFLGKHLCQSLFCNKMQASASAKRDSGAGVFMWIFVKFLRTPFLRNTAGWLLLSLWEDKTFHHKAISWSSFTNLKKILQSIKFRKKMFNAFYVQSLAFWTLKDKYSSFSRKHKNNAKLVELT